jgi:hypothetical protein
MQDTTADQAALPRIVREEGASGDGGWFVRLAVAHLRKRDAQRRAGMKTLATNGTEAERARAAIRLACVKCAFTGAAAGGVTTAAELMTAEAQGLAALATVPAAAIAIGSEMVFRAIVHLDLTWDLAEIFGVPFDSDTTAFWRLYALAFHTADHAEGTNDPGRLLLQSVLHLTGDEVGAGIGSKLLGESVLRNIVPGVAIASSSIANWVMTRRLGDTVRRTMRYHRAFRDAMWDAGRHCAAHRVLLAEGLWFLFTADGRLSPEETAALAVLVRTLTPEEASEAIAHFVEDDHDWQQRIGQLPENERDPFLHALEVAATVDNVVSLPERKILRGAARVPGRSYDEARIGRMMKQFDEVGVLKTHGHLEAR